MSEAGSSVSADVPNRVVWVHSPWFDLCFLANIAWPLLLWPSFSGPRETVIDFWQVYFLTLPHRWITLLLVTADPDRRGERGWVLAGMAVAFMLVVVGVWFGTAAFTCLALVDYCWNSWHFASQHSGVLRMYSRKLGLGRTWLEYHGIRAFIAYAILRTAGWATGWIEPDSWVLAIDHAALCLPAALIVAVLTRARVEHVGKVIYTLSVCALYSLLLLALANRWSTMIVPLTTASGLFHAVEYLGVVSHYAERRTTVGSDGAFRQLAQRWTMFLGSYLAVLGSLGVWLDRPSGPLHTFWQGANLWAAFVHYAFDGMIWKLRRSATAQALGVQSQG